MAPKRIRIELFPRTDYRKFHVTAQVSSERLSGGLLGGCRQDPFRVFTISGKNVRFSEDTKQTVLKFYDIDGVHAVGVDSSSVEITCQPAYGWEDFQDQVIETIKQVVGWANEDNVEVDYLYAGKTYAEEPWSKIEANQQCYERGSRRFGW